MTRQYTENMKSWDLQISAHSILIGSWQLFQMSKIDLSYRHFALEVSQIL